ncbi:hypothetical protein N7454_002431 [Penicillium verhagenii]|nr:hypothetical protein N7454_002431 [Penicillium verhagenii]
MDIPYTNPPPSDSILASLDRMTLDMGNLVQKSQKLSHLGIIDSKIGLPKKRFPRSVCLEPQAPARGVRWKLFFGRVGPTNPEGASSRSYGDCGMIQKLRLGEDGPRTVTSMSNLAMTWNTMGRISELLDLLTKNPGNTEVSIKV